jgi:hypothetical protein
MGFVSLLTGDAPMPKLKLDLDVLAVETFDTVAVDAERGTVQAFASVGDSTCRQAICYYETYAPGCTYGDTCAYTCANTCACATINPSCGYTCAYTCDDATCNTCVFPTDP